MPTTKNYEFPLYDPEDSPDLTTTGREAAAVIAIDKALKTEEAGRIEGDAGLNAALEKEATERKAGDKVLTDDLAKEVTDRKTADTALDSRIDAEATAREGADTALGERIDAEAAARESADTALGGRIDTEKADREAITGDIVKQLVKEKADRESADTALGGRIDNAETEISANSADLTGIKGLTYGDNHVAFLENNNGEYDSPALQEIAEQIAQKVATGDLNVAIYGTTTFAEVKAMLPNVVCKKDENYAQLCFNGTDQIRFFTLGIQPSHEFLRVYSDGRWEDIVWGVQWAAITRKPFSTVGSGLKVVDNALTLDGTAPSGGTNVSVSTGTGTNYTGLTVTPTTDGDTTRYDIALNAASKTARGGVTVGSGLNVNAAGIVTLDTASLPVVSGGAGILIDSSASNNRTAYTVLVDFDDTTIGTNDEGKLKVLSASAGGITGNTTWSELEA